MHFYKEKNDKNTAVSNFEMLRVSNNTGLQVGIIAPPKIFQDINLELFTDVEATLKMGKWACPF